MGRLSTYDPARTFAATGLTGSYQDVGAITASAVVGFAIYNTSDVDMQISVDDGVTNGPIIAAGGTFADNRYNQLMNSDQGSFVLPTNAQIQVKQVTGAGTTGNLIINVVRR